MRLSAFDTFMECCREPYAVSVSITERGMDKQHDISGITGGNHRWNRERNIVTYVGGNCI